MTKLTVRSLLKFLTNYSHWELQRKNGRYTLTFQQNLFCGYAETPYKIKSVNHKKNKSRRYNKSARKCVNKEAKHKTGGNVSTYEKTNGEFRIQCKRSNLIRQRRNSIGGNSDVDSLAWDDYDVVDPLLAANNTIQIKSKADEREDLTDLESTSVKSKESTPEMHREGNILLLEMKELRKEIQKMGDTSNFENKMKNMPTVPPKIHDKSKQELEHLMMKLEDDTLMWDSGFMDKKEEEEDDESRSESPLTIEAEDHEVTDEEEDTIDSDVEKPKHDNNEKKKNDEGGEEIQVKLSDNQKQLDDCYNASFALISDDDKKSFLNEMKDTLDSAYKMGQDELLVLNEIKTNIKNAAAENLGNPNAQLSKSKKKKLKKMRAKNRKKFVHRYTTPPPPSVRYRHSGVETSDIPRQSRFDLKSMVIPSSLMGDFPDKVETIMKQVSRNKETSGNVDRGIAFKDVFDWEVSFGNSEEKYRELIYHRKRSDQLRVDAIMNNL